jgi:hypothetical protein
MEENKKKTEEVEAECYACNGSGIFPDHYKERVIGVICRECGGSGKRIIRYIPFVGRNVRDDVTEVRWAKRNFNNFDEWEAGGEISYEEFLAGKTLPPLPEKE